MHIEKKTVLSYIGLGSNLDQPKQQLVQAVKALRKLEASCVVGCSRLYRSAPLGPSNQPDYYNAVIALETTLLPEPLLDQLQAIENAQGRVRKERWGARTLDLDILLYGNETIQTPRLTIPHSQLPVRNFVIYPLLDVAPMLRLPTGEALHKLASAIGKTGLQVDNWLPSSDQYATSESIL